MRVGRPERGTRRRATAAAGMGRTARPPRSRAAPALPLETIWTQALLRRLRSRGAPRVAVRVTDNVHTMLSFKRRAGYLEVRLHHMFLAAPDPVIAALARYIRGVDPTASRVLDRFIRHHRWLIRRVPAHVRRKRIPIRTKGAHHDLAEIFAELERTLVGAIDCEITWGSAPAVRLPRSSIKLGSYSADSRLIRIHPALDQAFVPRYFVKWIVFHEMLHHVHGISRRGGKRCVHTERFCEDERRFPAFERARAWERAHLDRLLAWRPGAPATRAPLRTQAACQRGLERIRGSARRGTPQGSSAPGRTSRLEAPSPRGSVRSEPRGRKMRAKSSRQKGISVAGAPPASMRAVAAALRACSGRSVASKSLPVSRSQPA